MWIVPALVCVMGIVVALLPPAEPIEDVHKPSKTIGTWAVATTALAVILIALHTVLAA